MLVLTDNSQIERGFLIPSFTISNDDGSDISASDLLLLIKSTHSFQSNYIDNEEKPTISIDDDNNLNLRFRRVAMDFIEAHKKAFSIAKNGLDSISRDNNKPKFKELKSYVESVFIFKHFVDRLLSTSRVINKENTECIYTWVSENIQKIL